MWETAQNLWQLLITFHKWCVGCVCVREKEEKRQTEKKKEQRKNVKKNICRVSAPCACCIELCTAVLNCERATHGLPADRAPVYRGCPDRDPLGCPLIPRQDGIRDKAPTLWLLQLLRLMQLLQLLQLLHACARAISIGHAFTNTPLGQMYVTWISTDLACTVMHRTSSIVPELRVQKLRCVQIVTFASRPATNLLYMNGSFSTISAAVHVLTSRTFCTCSLEHLE